MIGTSRLWRSPSAESSQLRGRDIKQHLKGWRGRYSCLLPQFQENRAIASVTSDQEASAFSTAKTQQTHFEISIGEKDLPPRQAGLLTIAAAMMVVAGLSYLAAELIRIDAWISPTYSWTVNKVPDLGSRFAACFRADALLPTSQCHECRVPDRGNVAGHCHFAFLAVAYRSCASSCGCTRCGALGGTIVGRSVSV